MKKVTLLGDSIRLIGYGKKTAELLKGDCEVYQPEDNCRFAKYMLRGLFDWKQDIAGSDVVHWNVGHWDVCRLFEDGTFSSAEEYVENVLRIHRILKTYARTVIFATTTPVKDGYPYNRNEDIQKFNRVATDALSREGALVNDLFSLVYPERETYLCEDKLHLSERGIEVCAQQAASVIKDNLNG